MRVRNLNVRRQSTHSNRNCLAHWEEICGQNAYLCFVKDCINRPSVCGLVQKDNLVDRAWYIVPLCSDCNKRTGQDLDIWDLAALVRADEPESPRVTAHIHYAGAALVARFPA